MKIALLITLLLAPMAAPHVFAQQETPRQPMKHPAIFTVCPEDVQYGWFVTKVGDTFHKIYLSARHELRLTTQQKQLLAMQTSACGRSIYLK